MPAFDVVPTRRVLLYQALADLTVNAGSAQQGATETSALAPSVLPPVVPAGMPVVGTKLNFIAYGAYKLPAVLNTLSLDFRFVLGGASFTATIPTSLFTLLSLGGSAPLGCSLDVWLTYRSITQAGIATVKRVGSLRFVDTTNQFRVVYLRGADLTVDTTVDCPFDARVKWSAVDATSTAQLFVDAAELTAIG